MLSKQEVLRILRRELPYLRETFHVKRIGIFGSYAVGTPTLDSDVDLIVEFEKPIGMRFLDLIDYLESILGRRVDVLTPEGIRNIRVRDVQQNITRGVIYA
jgi:predicted nucleotidyltransferase